VKQRRSKMQVIADILRVIENEGGVTMPTHILYKANLSHKLLKDHLNTLIQKGFVEVAIEKDRTLYKITEGGKKFLNEFRKIEKLAQVFGLPV
jgi:predicted transcriptional regulator